MTLGKVLSYIDVSRAISKDSLREHKHVSLIFYKKKLLSIGTNNEKTNPKALRMGYWVATPHSELAAFNKVPYTMRDGLILLNFRFNNRGELRMSKPCSRCLPWTQAVFKEIWYSDDAGMIQLK